MSAVLKFALPVYVERQIPKIGNFKFTFFIVWIPDSFYHGPALFQQKIMVKAELKRILALGRAGFCWDVLQPDIRCGLRGIDPTVTVYLFAVRKLFMAYKLIFNLGGSFF